MVLVKGSLEVADSAVEAAHRRRMDPQGLHNSIKATLVQQVDVQYLS